MEDENMDVEEDIFAGIQIPDEGSGSEYETSEAEQDLSQEEYMRERNISTPKASYVTKAKGQNGNNNSAKDALSQEDSDSEEREEQERQQEEESDPGSDSQTSHNDEQTQKDARARPAKAQSPSSVKLPLRQLSKNNLKRKESPIKLEENEPKKRWKQSLNPKYRDLLNIDIANAVARNIPEDNIPLQESQIGSSKWTTSEKEKFFIALSRLGRDNVKAISVRVGTKSELEIQEYIQLLHTNFIKRRIDGRILEHPDFPAALEISEECCEQLENTADAFATLQEKSEIETEQEKWGDSWLLTPEISHWLNKRRNQDGGKEAIDEVLPAANLFNLDKWLELSDRVYMNPDDEEDNWHNLAQKDQVPSIRATAFEDFHSLAVFITKKLISTTFYCTMSRERATQAHKTKHADVTSADVEAAINIIKMSHNSDEYWKKIARRCKLQIIDDDDDKFLTYDEVEAALSTFPHRRRSRSRSISHIHLPAKPESLPPSSEESEEDFESADESPLDYNSHTDGNASISISDTELGSAARSKIARGREEKVRAMEDFTESLDMQNSTQEELRLWKILRRAPPENLKEEELERPKRLVNEFDEQLEWREKVGFKSEWEVMEGMVGEDEFERNRGVRRRKSRAASKQRAQEGLSEQFVDGDEEVLTGLEGNGDDSSNEEESDEGDNENNKSVNDEVDQEEDVEDETMQDLDEDDEQEEE